MRAPRSMSLLGLPRPCSSSRTAWKSCEGYVYGDRHSASPATAAPPPSLPLPLSHRSRRHPAEPTRLAGSPSRMERQRRSGLWLGAWECRRQHAQRSMLGAAPSVPTTFVDEGGRWPIATIVTKCSLSGRSPSCLGWYQSLVVLGCSSSHACPSVGIALSPIHVICTSVKELMSALHQCFPTRSIRIHPQRSPRSPPIPTHPHPSPPIPSSLYHTPQEPLGKSVRHTLRAACV